MKSIPWFVYVVAILSIGLSLFFHFSESSDSMLNDKNLRISEAYLDQVVQLHETDITFSRRPLTNLGIRGLSSVTGFSTGVSFIVFNYLAYFISGILLYFLSLRLGANTRQGILNMLLYFFCFSNLFAFFPPIYSYDDPLQFLFIFAGLIALYNKKWLFYLLWFTLAMIAREGTLFLIPALFFFMQTQFAEKQVKLLSFESIKRGFLLALPVVFYIVFITVYVKAMKMQVMNNSAMEERLAHFKLNFDTQANAIESFISIYIICGVPLYLLYTSLTANHLKEKYLPYAKAFILTFVLNTLIVVLFTKTREARLLVLPLFFIWPVFVQTFSVELGYFVNKEAYRKLFGNGIKMILLIFLIFLSNLFCHKVFLSTAGGDDYFSGYLFFVNAFILLHLFLRSGFYSKAD